MPARADDRIEIRCPRELKQRFHAAVPVQERSGFLRRALEAALSHADGDPGHIDDHESAGQPSTVSASPQASKVPRGRRPSPVDPSVTGRPVPSGRGVEADGEGEGVGCPECGGELQAGTCTECGWRR